jgi:hypothetical protein
VTDYYNYDKITNIERVTPQNVTFPAILVCFECFGQEYYYRNESVKFDSILQNDLNVSLIKNFLYDSSFFKNENFTVVDNLLDFFIIPGRNERALDCLRFNAVTNKSVELFTASSSEDFFQVRLKDSYTVEINSSLNEFYNYTLFGRFWVYIGVNHMNSFEKLEFLQLNTDRIHDIKIQKESMETKLPLPFNPCQELSDGKPYHRWNCIEDCVFKKIKNEFNCTFPSSLFAIAGFDLCDESGSFYWQRFSDGCQTECPLEDCFSEKFTHDVTILDRTTGLTMANFYFRDLSTLNITQIPKTDAFTFLNNIGGGLGLFMGIALPNLLEFLQFLVDIGLIAFGW